MLYNYVPNALYKCILSLYTDLHLIVLTFVHMTLLVAAMLPAQCSQFVLKVVMRCLSVATTGE